MASVADLRAVCPHCGGRLAFPREAANQIVACPHCQSDTVLSLTKLMLVVGRPPEARGDEAAPPASGPDIDRPLSRKEQKALFASWLRSRLEQRAKGKDRPEPGRR